LTSKTSPFSSRKGDRTGGDRTSSGGAGQKTEYTRFCRFLEEVCGITLGEGKAYLVRSRLARIQREEGTETLGELIDKLEKTRSQALKVRIIDAMTTNETLWFRDSHPFDTLKDDLLPEISRRQSGVRIWSAACSTGQEPYSISMTVHEYLEKNPGRLPAGVEIIATDISPTALNQAREGRYDRLEIARGLTAERRTKYFVQEGDKLRIRDDIRKRVTFREINLLQSYVGLGRMDIVFCRNVLIYFSNDNKREILARIARVLRPGGYLFLGGSEPMANYSDAFEMVRCQRGVIYRLK